MSQQELSDRIRAALQTDPKRARRLIRTYALRAARNGEALHKGEALLFRGEADFRSGRLREALVGFMRAGAVFARARRKRHLFAARLNALQVCALLGRGKQARRLMPQVRRAAPDALRAAHAELAIGSALEALGDERGAERSFRKTLELLGRKRRPPAVALLRAKARNNLALRLVRRGAVSEGLRELDRALGFFCDQGLDAYADEARYNRGWARAMAGNLVDAFEDLRQAREAFRKQRNGRDAALALLDEAELVLRAGDARDAARRARTAVRELHRCSVPLETARAQLTLARAERATGRIAHAARAARAARTAFRRAGDKAGGAMASVLLAEDLAGAESVLRRSGHWLWALEALLARARALPGTRGARLLQASSSYPASLRRWVQPDLCRLRAEARGADRIAWLRRAVRAAEDLRVRAPTGRLRAATLASHLACYEMLAQALLERGRARDRREAFLVLDALRARTLREEIERQAPALFDPPGVRAMRERLEQLWRALERRDGEPGNLRRVEDPLLHEVGRHERALVRALEQEPAAAGTPLVQELPRDPCLAYSVLGGEVVGLFARAGEVQAWSCGRLSRLRSEQASFRFQVRRRLHGSSDPGPALACLERIAARLLPTGTSWGGVRRLTVVLPPELGALPVEALPAGGRPLLSRCTVVHAPSATLPRRTRKKLRAPLVVGIEDRALPEVRRELNSVLRRLPDAAVLRGSAATRDAVLQALARRRLVHIAGHARAREDIPLLSALRVRDGWIAAADLRDRRLDGALVVLSACRTGDPSLLWNGEAMGGFPRTLLAAGASTLIASRWEIPDDIAHAWMRGFYRRLETDGPEAALNGAARTMLRHHPHPADWCAFLCIRNPG